MHMKQLAEYTKTDYIKRLKSRSSLKAIEELATVFSTSDVCSDVTILTHALVEREKIMSTGIGMGIAVPHAKISAVHELAFAIGVSKSGIDFNSLDKKPVHLIILVIAGEGQHTDYLKLLSRILIKLKEKKVLDRIINFSDVEDVIQLLSQD
jgi:nitrogen PTS system EIIA component